MRVYEAVARYLAEERAGRPVFGLMGDANLGFLGAYMEHEGGRYIGAALEGGAVSMADGWARQTDEVGVASVTHGPALTNTLTALTEAVRSHSPIVLLTGSPPEVNGHFQYTDIEGFARYAGAGFVKVRRADELLAMLDKAFMLAAASSTAVVLDVPFALLRHEVEYRAPKLPTVRGHRVLPDTESVDEALALLVSAKRPLLVAGRGAVVSGAREQILELSRAINAPVMTTVLAKDYFDGEPENLGIHGTLSNAVAIDYMADVDVVLTFGASLNAHTTDKFDLMKGRILIQSDADPAALSGYGPADQVIVADAAALAQALLDRLVESEIDVKHAAYMDAIAAAPHREAKDMYTSTTGDGYIDMRDATRWFSGALPKGAPQVSDVGRFVYSTWPHITVDAERWVYAGTFGSIGLGTATAVGVAAAHPDVPTGLYVGDGGLMQGIVELSTAVRHNLPLVVMVLNDDCYGAEYLKLDHFGSSVENALIDWPSFADVARSLGAQAVRATSMEDLESAEQLIADGQFPLLIEVIADPHKVANRPGLVPTAN
ncbi:MAG: thiamine pyrophosphate-binding protein [Brevibacterium yomogidense]|uniref:thiamine pyrophosphate-binding protein n=1 Tax=Brevibacterium sp. Mu109 TaxID=1255669 RepID=UPI000C37637E|nr:thiamine pyrophosphate-dependent enzyme [Brevibacterium sp. Mu109]SMX81925.1 Acetolactate synthase large subunit [Brevibacterium sp. Mu109]